MRDDDRPVTPPPPQTPSSTYLALAEQDPSRVDDPTSSRKLLVLDLNGTLLHRSPHIPRPKSRHYGFPEDRKRDQHGNFLPRLRPVHPRPYMPAFRDYLFHYRTKGWLDVMVWSSAQPHSVDDMVDKCFGEHKDQLLAVWARDTLGLSNDHYFRKVQTIKDLAKPWSLLSPQSTNLPSSPHSSIASTPRSSPEPSSPSRPSDESTGLTNDVSPQAHSALTTLLLDDSPRKAELQPFNHVCIGEYSGEQRVKDLDNLQKEQDWTAVVDARRQFDVFVAKPQTSAPDTNESAEPGPSKVPAESSAAEQERAAPTVDVDEDAAPASPSKKRKRKEKKLHKRATLLEQAAKGDGPPAVSYDETLLSVIGVLDEIKSQANVAAWIRAGGLWGSHHTPASTSERSNTEVVASTSAPPPASSRVGSDGNDAEEDAGAQSDDSTLSVDKPKSWKRKRVRGPTPGEGRMGRELAVGGNDEVTAVPASSLPAPETETEAEAQKMWFEHPGVMGYWAGRGRKTLEELAILVEHGIER